MFDPQQAYFNSSIEALTLGFLLKHMLLLQGRRALVKDDSLGAETNPFITRAPQPGERDSIGDDRAPSSNTSSAPYERYLLVSYDSEFISCMHGLFIFPK